MRIKLITLFIIVVVFSACNNQGKAKKIFCDTVCMKDTLKFTGTHKLKPYVYISAKNCLSDTILWSYEGFGTNRKMAFPSIHLNKDFLRCYIKDTAYAWIVFNDCSTGRGYFFQLPFNKKADIRLSKAAINNYDPKFSVAENLIAYTDRGNIYVEDIVTGKTAMMTFGKPVDIDFDEIHNSIDSVKINRNSLWVKVKIDDEWKELKKDITLQ
jgi:hypothetical protein